MTELIYKLVTPEEWQAAQKAGVYEGAPIDIQDGFIHFSTAEQVVETCEKHFRGKGPLLLIGFDSDMFGETLKWEVSRGGAHFPHLYQTLDPTTAKTVHELPSREDGGHDFPEGF